MKVVCGHCGHKWNYKGRRTYWITCPNCMYKVNIKKLVVRKREEQERKLWDNWKRGVALSFSDNEDVIPILVDRIDESIRRYVGKDKVMLTKFKETLVDEGVIIPIEGDSSNYYLSKSGYEKFFGEPIELGVFGKPDKDKDKKEVDK